MLETVRGQLAESSKKNRWVDTDMTVNELGRHGEGAEEGLRYPCSLCDLSRASAKLFG